MSRQRIAYRYAKALAELAEGQNSLLDIQKELHQISQWLKEQSDLNRFVFAPLIAPSRKAAAFDAILGQAGASTLLRSFFKVVAQAARLNLLPEIAESYDEVMDERKGVVKAHVESAHEMSPEQLSALEKTLGQKIGKGIRLRWTRRNELLGGLRVQVGSTVYDASIQGQLNQIRAKLLATSHS